VPTGQVHINAALTNLSIAYGQGQNIIRGILPPFPTDHQSDLVWKYGKELFLSKDDVRAGGTEAKNSDWGLTTVQFECSGHALQGRIAREKEHNADPALNLLADTTMLLTQQVRLNEEINGIAKIVSAMGTASYVADQSKTAWNSANFDPYGYLKGQIDTIGLQCGRLPNTLALSRPVWTAIRKNPNVVGLITGAPQLPSAGVSTAQFAELLELKEILVGEMVYNTTLGQALSWAWGQKALLFYKDPNPGLRVLSLGYTPIWTKALAAVTGLEKVPGMDGMGDQFVQQYFWEPEIADYVVAHSYYDQQLWAPECGQLYTGCLGTANA